MGTVYKIDGIGTRGNPASDNPFELVNKERRLRFVRMFASEALAKGDAVALDLTNTEPTNGFGNHVLKADTSDDVNFHAIGIATEACDSGDLVSIEVAGYCDFAKIHASDTAAGDEGDLLVGSQTAGQLEKLVTDAARGAGGDSLPCAILIDYIGAAAASSKVYLLNPANL